ncbi:MAG: acyltransferase [Burkholderiales bacterium]|nr:acyltransferase [Burkholderiales bacterium]
MNPVPASTSCVPIARNEHIDLFRGIAILTVLVLHFALAFGLKNSPLAAVLPKIVLVALGNSGNYGVTLFFVISGYLITSNSLARWGHLSRMEIGRFYAYRFARIMPPLLLVLLIIVILGSLDVPFFDNSDGDHALPASYFVIAVGSVLTFWHNVLMQSQGYFNYCLNIYWSLSVEEVFYLALPLACVLLRKNLFFILLCLAAIMYAPFYRAQHADNELFFMYGYAACFDAIALGCLTALIAPRFSLPFHVARLLRICALLACFALYLIGIHGHEAFGFSWMALAAAVYIFAAATPHPGAASHATAPLRWFGRYSYELYLFHIVVLALLRNIWTREQVSYAARLPLMLAFLALSAALAWLVARYVAEPANRWLRQRMLGVAT